MNKVLKVHPEAQVPSRGSLGAAGYDLYACEYTIIPRGKIVKVRTGIAIELADATYHMKIVSRSGLASKGLYIINSPGIVDSDYRGEILCAMINNSSVDHYIFYPGDRIAQLLIEKSVEVEFELVDELTPSSRGSGGFGSSGN